jgi:hypothetical protein
VAALLLATVLAGAEPASSTAPEYQIKAAFLLNFAKFVEWPAEDSALPAAVAICVIGDDPFGSTLDQLVQGESVGLRRIVVRRNSSVPEDRCHVAYIASPARDTARLLQALGPGVLTVGEGSGFLREGGMIAFVIDQRRVRFDVNQAAARNSSVRLSSRLLSVARSVER